MKGFMRNLNIQLGVLHGFSKLQETSFSFPPKGFFRTGFSKQFSDFEGPKTSRSYLLSFYQFRWHLFQKLFFYLIKLSVPGTKEDPMKPTHLPTLMFLKLSKLLGRACMMHATNPKGR